MIVIVNMYHLDFRHVKLLGKLLGYRKEHKVENAKDDIHTSPLIRTLIEISITMTVWIRTFILPHPLSMSLGAMFVLRKKKMCGE